MPAPQLIAAGIGAAADLAQGIIGSGARRKEQQEARVAQREAEFNYKNFDYNQDVGPINDPYAQRATELQQFETTRNDQTAANVLQAQQRAGNFGAVQNLIGQQARAAQETAQRAGAIRQQGALFVEQQRQQRISQRYDQAGTFLARADDRLAAADAARKRATEKLFKGIGGAAAVAAQGFAEGGELAGDAGGLTNNKGLNFAQGLKNNSIARQAVQATNFEDLGDGVGFYNDLDEI